MTRSQATVAAALLLALCVVGVIDASWLWSLTFLPLGSYR